MRQLLTKCKALGVPAFRFGDVPFLFVNTDKEP